MFIFFFLYLTLHVPLSCFCPFSSSLYTQRVLSRFRLFSEIVRCNQATNSRVSNAERQLINLKSELDAIHRARLTQMNTLSTQSNLLLVYQKNLQDGQMEVKNLHAERYEAENQMSRVVEETETTK